MTDAVWTIAIHSKYDDGNIEEIWTLDMEMTTSFLRFCIHWTGKLQHRESKSQNIRRQNNWMGARPLRDRSNSLPRKLVKNFQSTGVGF